MVEEKSSRRLAAILAADVVDYSRLMHEDEAKTVAAWQAARRDAIDPVLEVNKGRVVKRTGDGFLAEFATVEDAVRCAVVMQEALSDGPLDFRMGINLGDITDDGDDIHGDGVNIAARIEGLAEPGGICISGSVYDQVHNKLNSTFADMGEQKVKNIATPVRVYSVVSSGSTGAVSDSREESGPGRLRTSVFATAIGILIAAIGIGFWWYQQGSQQVDTPTPNTAATTQSDKLSIAVLPFNNLSGDKSQEYFADGMSEDLITDLSKISGLLVVARNSTFAYKGQQFDIRDVARELGVRYVVEGSVRKASGRVRITAQLIDADTGLHVWADRYDRELNDIFALQDEVRQRIIEALQLKLTGTDKHRLDHQGTTNVAAYDLFLQGREFESMFSREGLAEALRLYSQAIEIDPNYSDAYARMANVHGATVTLGLADDVDKARSTAISLAERAVEIDAENPFAHWSLGQILFRVDNSLPNAFVRSIAELERAIEIDPNYADVYAQLSYNYSSDGRFEIARQSIKTAMRLNPRYPFWYLIGRGRIYYMQKNYTAAIADLEAAEERNPAVTFSKWMLAAAYAQAGRIDDAEWQIEEIQNNGFNLNVDDVLRILALQRQVDIDHYREGLIKAGLPDG